MPTKHTITASNVIVSGVVITERTADGVWFQYADEPDEEPMFLSHAEITSIVPE